MRICLVPLLFVVSVFGCSSSTTGGSTSTPGGDAGSGGGGTDAAVASTGTSITGTLGALGAVQPTVTSLVISNSGETLIYMSSAPITCTMLQTSRWLGSTAAGSQVVEIVIKGNPTVTTIAVPPGEVNYAGGGKSSAYEVNADSGSITFTKAMTNGPVEGTVSAKYADGSQISGTFKADFCAMGQGY